MAEKLEVRQANPRLQHMGSRKVAAVEGGARVLALAVAAITNNRRRGGFSTESADRAIELTRVEGRRQPLNPAFAGCDLQTSTDNDCASLKTPFSG
jgi:hypothetical protein